MEFFLRLLSLGGVNISLSSGISVVESPFIKFVNTIIRVFNTDVISLISPVFSKFGLGNGLIDTLFAIVSRSGFLNVPLWEFLLTNAGFIIGFSFLIWLFNIIT